MNTLVYENLEFTFDISHAEPNQYSLEKDMTICKKIPYEIFSKEPFLPKILPGTSENVWEDGYPSFKLISRCYEFIYIPVMIRDVKMYQ